jgi:hypothetical protein
MNALDKLVEHAADLAFELPDGTPVVKLGLIVTLYYRHGYTLENKQKVMECFTRFHKEFGSHLKGHYFERYKKLISGSFEKTHDKVLSSEPNEQYHWYLSSASNANEAEDYSLATLNSFEIHGDKKRSYIKLVMPWAVLKEPKGLERYQEWLVYLCNQVKAEHGYGGLSSILPYDYHSYMPTEYQLAQQFSGLEVDSMAHIGKSELLEQIKGVNWFTVLGNTYVERLGGEAAIRHALSGRGDISIMAYDHGLIIRAGQYPELGATQDGLPAAYVAVNQVIRPVRIPNPDQLHSYSPYGDCFEQESTTLWYARFDQDEAASATPTRIEAGQPCTHTGYWFTPAQANSRRHFKQGELMPSFGDSNWGDTLWYWAGEDSQ